MYISFSSVTYTGHKFSTNFYVYIFHLNFYKSIAYKYTESLECLHITTEENKTRAERTLLKDQICFGCAAAAAAAKSLQSCPTLCDPTDGSPPGSPVPGILQARTLEWVAMGVFDFKNKIPFFFILHFGFFFNLIFT